MPYIDPEIVKKAKELDLYTYLSNYEPSELVHFSGNTYTTKTHDSLKISNGKWMWWSRGIGGKSALDYLIKVKGHSFTDAVSIISRNSPSYPSIVNDTKPKPAKLLLPPKNSSTDVIKKYLKSRFIDEDIIDYCIDKGYIFESSPHHNVVFLGFDNENNPRHASFRGTGTERFLGDATGSDKNFSFRITTETSNSVHVFESAIDLLSYATLLKMKGHNFLETSLLSLAGVYKPQNDILQSKVPKALLNFLNQNNSVKRVVFHLDNDEAGILATKAIMAVLPDNYKKLDNPMPYGKDVNDYLCKFMKDRERSCER